MVVGWLMSRYKTDMVSAMKMLRESTDREMNINPMIFDQKVEDVNFEQEKNLAQL